jgi:hypothetical protein
MVNTFTAKNLQQLGKEEQERNCELLMEKG